MTRIRSILGGAAGNLVEWFDWYVYSAFSLYFAPVFFPGGDPAAQFIKTSGIFAAGFLMRPVGGWLLGRVADAHGRRTALGVSVGLMGGGSLLLAAIPGYAVIGVGAPALLLVARLVQGLSLGGEYGAAATYLSEVASPRRRGFWSSFQYVTLYGGQLLALALLLAMQAGGADEAALAAWGWRVAFLASAVLALLVFWLRRGIAESPEFERLDRSFSSAEAAPARSPARPPIAYPDWEVGRGNGPVPPRFGSAEPSFRKAGGVAELWRDHRRAVLIAFALAMGSNVIFYTFTTYMQKYLVVSSGFDKAVASRICAGAIFVAMIAQPAFGALSDRIGRKPLQYAFGFGGLLLTVPLMLAIGRTHDPVSAFLLLLAGLAFLSCSTGTNAAVKSELFPVHLRALGIGLPYALSQSLFGGTAEALALSLKQAGHEAVYFWYASGMAGIALLAAVALRESAPRLQDGSRGNAQTRRR